MILKMEIQEVRERIERLERSVENLRYELNELRLRHEALLHNHNLKDY